MAYLHIESWPTSKSVSAFDMRAKDSKAIWKHNIAIDEIETW